MKEEELKNLQLLRPSSPKAETAYQLVEKFLQMVRERTGEQLDVWLEEVKASQLEAFASFTTGVQADKDAVVAAICQNVWLFRQFDTAGEPYFRACFNRENTLKVCSAKGFASSIQFGDRSSQQSSLKTFIRSSSDFLMCDHSSAIHGSPKSRKSQTYVEFAVGSH